MHYISNNTSFDTLFKIFFGFFTIWLIYTLYNYIYFNREIRCLICNESEKLNQMYRCQTLPQHKLHKRCF